MKRKNFFWIFIGVMFLSFHGILIYMQYQSYLDKMYLIYQMGGIENKEQGLYCVAEILKGDGKKETKNSKELLKEYGYTENYRNVYTEQLYREILLIFFLSSAGFGVVIYGIYKAKRKTADKYNEELQKISEWCTKLREGMYEVEEKESLLSSTEHEMVKRLSMDFESLTMHMKLITEAASTEKEEVKSIVTNLSHQLKTPVAALKTSLEILAMEGLTKQETKEFLERAGEQAERLEELFASLLQISRMEAGMIELHMEKVPVLDTISMAVSRIYPKAEEKKINIFMNPEEVSKEEFVILQDKKWLSEALINILENGIKYSGEETSLYINVEKMINFLRIEVEDEGIGIPQKEQHKVFKRFYRSDREEVRKKNGSGVGLYLAREIVEKHYGTIKVISPPPGKKQGSRFVLQLPL